MSKQALKEIVIEPWPCTIIRDRYGGTHSGGQWLAFEKDRGEIPNSVGSDDVDEVNFFYETQEIIGKGSTPDKAYQDLKTKLKGKNVT